MIPLKRSNCLFLRGVIQHYDLCIVGIILKSVKEYNIKVSPKKSFWCDVEEKCLRNSKIFFDGVFLSIYSHLLKNLELSKLCRKKVIEL